MAQRPEQHAFQQTVPGGALHDHGKAGQRGYGQTCDCTHCEITPPGARPRAACGSERDTRAGRCGNQGEDHCAAI